jgi:hypothetical protein
VTLTADQAALYRAFLGSTTDLADVEARFARLQDDFAVIQEVRQQRYNTALQAPAQFNIPGDYSENRAANIDAMQKEGAGGSVVQVAPVAAQPGWPYWTLDTEQLFNQYNRQIRRGYWGR